MKIKQLTLQRTALLAFASLLLATSACHRKKHHQATEDAPDFTSQVKSALAADTVPGLKWPNYKEYKKYIDDLYAQNGYDVLWSDDGKPTKQALALVRNFQHAAERGLIPDDYDAWTLLGRIGEFKKKDPQKTAETDVALTVDAMRFISDLHIGRVNPQRFAFGVNVEQKRYNLSEFVQQHLIDSSDVDNALNDAEPQSPEYSRTKAVLAQYVALLSQDNTEPVPAGLSVKPIEPRQPYRGSLQLAARLQLFGDLDKTPADVSPSQYDPQLTDALKHFQHRHGIAEDGKIGKDTIAAINVPLGVRVNQLTDALERWRWLSDEFQNAAIMVNLPEFTLRAFSEGHHEDFKMRVVVGQSVAEHRTPVIADHMKYLVFRPYWNVPPSIMKAEIAPHMRRDPGYLASHNFETVDAKGKPASSSLESVANARVIVREKPGPRNSLGLVKFLFPNQFNVYLHSTPATELFSRTKRDFSHGCVRLQEPEKLAQWVLRDQPKWDADAIHEAMENGTDNKTVLLTHPIPIVIFYATAYPGEDGEMHFFADTYTYDKMLEDTLRHGPPYPQAPSVQKVIAEE